MFKCKDGVCPKTKLDACCFHCAEKDRCEDVCPSMNAACENMEEIIEENTLIEFNQTTQALVKSIADLTTRKKALEEKEKAMKDQLREAMERYGIKSADTPLLKLTYVASSMASTVDSPKLKRRYPTIAAECTKQTPRAAYVKVEVKGGGK